MERQTNLEAGQIQFKSIKEAAERSIQFLIDKADEAKGCSPFSVFIIAKLAYARNELYFDNLDPVTNVFHSQLECYAKMQKENAPLDKNVEFWGTLYMLVSFGSEPGANDGVNDALLERLNLLAPEVLG